jgi:uncharacterized protein (TIGR03545 family)
MSKLKIFRWKAIGPLLLFGLVLVVLWIVFADSVARSQAESNLSATLGTQVDIGGVRIREADAAVDVYNLAIADPRNPMRNLLEAGDITLDLDPIPLTEKKVVIEQFKLGGLRMLTTRKTPARPADPNSPAGKLLSQTTAWAKEKFNFPKLALGRIDSVKSLVLQPGQLGTVQAAQAFVGTVDSTRTAFEQSLADLQVKPLVDSSTALATRLAKTDVKKLGIAGAKDAVSDVKKAIDRLKATKGKLENLEKSARSSLAALKQGLGDVDAARQKDYAFARGLLELPSFAAPDIGASLFGQQSTDYFADALYYAKLAEKYIPPGLQPWNRPGPKRTRMDGTTVEFPKMQEYPRFLLRKGDIDLALGSKAQNTFSAAVANVTSQPALLGLPATLTAKGSLAGDHPMNIDLTALSRHFGSNPKDSLQARVTGVPLPTIPFPGLPFGVNPGRSTVGLSFAMAGDRLAGAWEITSNAVTWSADSGRLQSASLVESTVWRVISGLNELRVRAELSGTVESPVIKVQSNLDDAIAARLRGLVGEELAKAEAKARAAVDKLVDDQVKALSGKVDALQATALQKLPLEKEQVDGVQKQLEVQLKRLAGSATGGISLPKL